MAAGGVRQVIAAVPPGMYEAALRALLIGGSLAWVAPAVRGQLATRRWLWWFVLAPLLTPSVVVAFAYVGWSPGTPASLGREFAYGLLLAARLLPVAVILQFVLPPPPLDPAGRHCLVLARAPRSAGAWHGPRRDRLTVGGLVFVLAFQEFELASLFFGVRSWTVALFDAQVGGSPLASTLGQAGVPVLIEIAVLVTIASVLLRTRAPRDASLGISNADATPSAGGWLAPVIATTVLSVWPGCLLLTHLPGVSGQLQFVGQVWHSVVLACGAMVCAGTLALVCSIPTLCVLSIPGLASGLVLALGVVAVFQTPALATLYDTPVPILLTWTLMLLPIATVFRLAIERFTSRRAVHLSRMLEGSPLESQRLEGRRLYFALRGSHLGLAAAFLFLLAFFEVIAGQLLAPSGMPPAAPTLYNMMHYGRSPGLAAMAILMVLGASGCAALGYVLWRCVRRLPGRGAVMGP
jgi:ABC-type Fe3+ transport system permease subunit